VFHEEKQTEVASSVFYNWTNWKELMSSQKQSDRNVEKQTVSAVNRAEGYDAIGQYMVEIYDQTETQRDDVKLIQSLVGETKARILEPFCGNGRILIPLAEAGHEVTGLDLSDTMLQSLAERVRELPAEVQARMSFRKSDIIADEWPNGFDVVILGANCLYELATPEEQEHCLRAAGTAMRAGGYLYLDNNHMEGELDPAWCKPGVNEKAFPRGVCADGTQVRGTSETIWFDAGRRLHRARRTVTIQTPDGVVRGREYVVQKHPPSTDEMRGWLTKHGFVIEQLWGDRHRSQYSDHSGRAIFWAEKK